MGCLFCVYWDVVCRICWFGGLDVYLIEFFLVGFVLWDLLVYLFRSFLCFVCIL